MLKFDGKITTIGVGVDVTSPAGRSNPDTSRETVDTAATMHTVRIKNKIILTRVCETVVALEQSQRISISFPSIMSS